MIDIQHDHEKINQAILELSASCGFAFAEITRGFNAVTQSFRDIGSEAIQDLYRSFWTAMYPKKKRRGKKWKGYKPK